MASLFNQGFSKSEILKQVGDIRQIAGTQWFEHKSGMAKGASGIRIRNGLGLDLTLLPDNGLDIFELYFKGTPLSWISKNGVVSNPHFDGRGTGWLKSFAGGMLVTCGLRNVGPPCEDEGEHFGLHGNYTSLPAENLAIREYWKGDHFYIEVSGRIQESRVFGGSLVNYRTVGVSSRDNRISINDRIVNEGFHPEPLMILYHFNWGSPLFGPNTLLQLKPAHTEIRGNNASPESWDLFLKPQAGFEEKVYLHRLQHNDENKTGYKLFNPVINLGVKAEWDMGPLPCFTQWLMNGEGEYVLGMEPGNCFPTGRANERKLNRLEILPSQAEKVISIVVEVFDHE